MAYTPQSVYFSFFGFLRRFVSIVFSLSIVCLLILFGLQLNHRPSIDTLWLVVQLHGWGDPLLALLAKRLGTAWPTVGTSYLPLGVVAGVWIVKIFIDGMLLKMRRVLLGARPMFVKVESQTKPTAEGEMEFLDAADLSSAPPESRVRWLKRYLALKKSLSGEKKHLAFLSVDIVGSTTMKLGEDQLIIEHAFGEYKTLVERIFKEYGVWKSTWTPDGVMACFLRPDLGVSAAKQIIRQLKVFNENVNQMKKIFRVRCGLNAGEVAADESIPMEEIADETVDVAGHLQKYAKPDGLWVSEEVWSQLSDQSGFNSVDTTVDGRKARAWQGEGDVSPSP